LVEKAGIDICSDVLERGWELYGSVLGEYVETICASRMLRYEAAGGNHGRNEAIVESQVERGIWNRYDAII